MYICDQGNNHIQVYHIPENGKGELWYSYCGQEDNLFNHSTDMALNICEDKLFVTDTDNHRVQVLTVCCTIAGEVFVSAKDNVFIFKENGTYVFAIDFTDQEPTGVTVNRQKMLVVSLTRDGEIVFYSWWITYICKF